MQRVALIGAGKMGLMHAQCYSRMSNAKLVAVMDVRPEAAAEVYRRAGEPCRACGSRLLSGGQGDGNRTTYWCPVCQGSSADRPRRR